MTATTASPSNASEVKVTFGNVLWLRSVHAGTPYAARW